MEFLLDLGRKASKPTGTQSSFQHSTPRGSRATPTAHSAKSKKHKPRTHNRKNNKDDSDSEKGANATEEEDDDDTLDEGGGMQPGRLTMVSPPTSIPTPLFELDSIVTLRWEYDDNLDRIPRRLMLSVELPHESDDGGKDMTMMYDIATNITGTARMFMWDSRENVPDGVGLREGRGYRLHVYDSDLGFVKSSAPPPGRLLKFSMPFSLYASRYEKTNDGVPRDYNPNSAASLQPFPLVSIMAILIASGWMFW
ncbi:hypothetical protein H4219_002776 [Mycoemilia scoparia]|uniref:DUF7137 domain-containing protein n=1 Tax=Mycoemilia scoparia TaxID=417184 RepID=A0A9W8A1N9_9FUNG|nr:hypothetical protein H4219_002776 [Mycoemilia scoparia]